MIFRLVHRTHFYDIPPFLLINMDQQGVYILPHNNTTYHETGARQVDIAAKEEKRAYTICVASTPDSNFLPFQQVWAGKSSKSLLSLSAKGMQEALEFRIHFAYADSGKRTSYNP